MTNSALQYCQAVMTSHRRKRVLFQWKLLHRSITVITAWYYRPRVGHGHWTTAPQKYYNTTCNVVQQKDHCQRTQNNKLYITVLTASYDKSQKEKSTFFIKQLLYICITVMHNLALQTMCGSWSLNNCSVTARTVHCSSVQLAMTDQGRKDLLFHWTSGP